MSAPEQIKRTTNVSSLGTFVWGIADQLRGVYKPHQYGSVILPMTILRRLDAQMGESRDRMRELAQAHDNPNLLATKVRKECGLGFYNTSQFDLARLIADPDNLAANLVDYVNRFSPNIDVFERFKFEAEIATLAEKNRLLLVVRQFAEIDLHPDTVPNAEMGDLFEHLIRKFAEASNEEAGEHFTPRDAIRLIVDLLFAEDNEALTQGAVVRTVYDPTAGTGGMLSVAEDHLVGSSDAPGLNPQARLVMFGQEINDQSYAICKSDMIAKGQDPTNIRLGDTLADDKFAGKTFDYCMSNPPYGVDWKASAEAITAERAATGAHGRFAPGLPKIGDGQMLFLTHLAHKMRPIHEGGGRAGIVLNGSPLFNGAAESGESEIRRYLLENDLVEAIVALPTNMFFNTGISTYIWILDNTKCDERVGKVQLVDGSGFFTKMRKNLGDKSREISEADRSRILSIYDAFDDQTPDAVNHSRIFDTTDFGYWTVTVERPLRQHHEVSEVALARVMNSRAWASWVDPNAPALLRLLGTRFDTAEQLSIAARSPTQPAIFVGTLGLALVAAESDYDDWLAVAGPDGTVYEVGEQDEADGGPLRWMATANGSWDDVRVTDAGSMSDALIALNHQVHGKHNAGCPTCSPGSEAGRDLAARPGLEQVPWQVYVAPPGRVVVPPAVLKELSKATATSHVASPLVLDRKGYPESDTSLRDTENIPFGWAPPGKTGDSRYGEGHRDEIIKTYFEHEVKPHVPDAWIDHAKTKTGYEIPFTRHFYKYIPPRPLEEIDADLDVLVKEIIGLLQEIEA